MDYVNSFIDFMSSVGCTPANKSEVIADDKRRRFQLEGDRHRTRNGSYQLKIEDGFAVGWVRSFKEGVTRSWYSKQDRKISKEERDAFRERIADDRAAREQREADLVAATAEKADNIWKRAKREGDSDYLVRKGVSLNGARIYRGLIVVPVKIGSSISTLQFIAPDGQKRFLRDGKKEGGYFPIATAAEPKDVILLCEGYATGCSLREATGLPVSVAFDAGNLRHVAAAMRKKYPDAVFVICADNDVKSKKSDGTPYNAGIEGAKQAAVAAGNGFVVWPEFSEGSDDTDFNDYSILCGPDAVRDRVMAVVANAAVRAGAGEGDSLEDVQHPAGPDYPDFEPAEMPFKILGHDGGIYYFLPRSSGQIVKMTTTAMGSMVNLFRLCPRDYWADHFGLGGEESSKKIAENAANALITQAHQVGIFRPSNIRGIGAWVDDGRNVLHCGDTLLVDGEEVKPHKLPSRFVYPLMSATMRLDAERLTNKQAIRLREICAKLSWETKLSGDLLAGWCVIAPVCAAIPWRPHIWITGESQSGKSSVLENVVSNMLGEIALHVEGGTTEAALRQMIGFDGRPVIYDEAEAETQKDRGIMEGLMQLVRRSSSGGKIVKGSASGEAMSYTLRSSFCFSGINPVIKHRADESRITQLVLKRAHFPDADLYYQDLRREIRETLTPEFGRGLLARTIANLSVLVENCRAFADAAADVLCDRRAADQIGAMLAGLYLLSSTARVSHDKAVEWIKCHDWTTHTAIAEQSDPERLLMFISTRIIRFVCAGTSREATVGTLIARALGRSKETLSPDHDAETSLRNYGIWPTSDGVLIANRSPNLEGLLRDSAWSSWKRTLGDLPGAEKIEPRQFAVGFNQRSVKVPLSAFGL